MPDEYNGRPVQSCQRALCSHRANHRPLPWCHRLNTKIFIVTSTAPCGAPTALVVHHRLYTHVSRTSSSCTDLSFTKPLSVRRPTPCSLWLTSSRLNAYHFDQASNRMEARTHEQYQFRKDTRSCLTPRHHSHIHASAAALCPHAYPNSTKSWRDRCAARPLMNPVTGFSLASRHTSPHRLSPPSSPNLQITGQAQPLRRLEVVMWGEGSSADYAPPWAFRLVLIKAVRISHKTLLIGCPSNSINSTPCAPLVGRFVLFFPPRDMPFAFDSATVCDVSPDICFTGSGQRF